MEGKFTPGPWKASFTKFSEVRAENGALVAKCERLGGLVNLEANARLIAAAPDLLEALEAVVEHGYHRGDVDYYKKGISTATPAGITYAKVVAAIAKARGK